MGKKYAGLPVRDYVNELSLRTPAPGGGSAAALTSALGISLLLMAANYTRNKRGFEKHQDELEGIIRKLEHAKKEMLRLMDEDVVAYLEFSKAVKTNRRVNAALKNALKVPRRIFENSFDLLRPAKRLAEIGNPNLASDVACGVTLLRAAIETAGVNIDVNLSGLDDVKFSVQLHSKYLKLLKLSSTETGKVLTMSGRKIWRQR